MIHPVNPPRASRTIATYVALAFLVASATWLAMLLHAALHLRAQTGSVELVFGPFQLHTLTKVAYNDIYHVSLSTLPGAGWFWLSWVMAGLAVGCIRAWVINRRNDA